MPDEIHAHHEVDRRAVRAHESNAATIVHSSLSSSQMWTTGVEIVMLDQHESWSSDRELELGIDALVHGFDRLL